MHRTNIYLTDDEHRLLTARARQEGTSMAQVVRNIIDRELGLAEPDPSLHAVLEQTAGIWHDRSDDELDQMRRFRGLERAAAGS